MRTYFKEGGKTQGELKKISLNYLKYKYQHMICFPLLKVQISNVLRERYVLKTAFLNIGLKLFCASEI